MALKLVKRNGIFYMRGTVAGTPVYESAKTDDKDIAEKKRIKREGQLLSDSINGEVKNCTFLAAAVSYIANGGDPTFVGTEKDDGEWTGLIGHFADRILRTITQDELDEAGRKLYPDCQPQTINRQCHAPFVTIWSRANKNGYCDVRTWSRPQWQRGQFNGLVKREMKRRVGSFPVSYDHAAPFVLAMSPAPAMLMTALFYTGMRPSELFALRAEAVSVKARWINLDWNTKTEQPRGVPMAEILVPLFTALVKRGGILFRTPRGQPYPIPEGDDKVSGQMKSAINGARRRTGINDISPYTARHTVSSQLVAAGVHEFIKDQILGHASTSTSQDYTYIAQPKLIEDINKLPVIEAWANAPWMIDPLAYASKLVEGTGERTDLAKLKVRREKWAKAVAKKKATVRQRKHREIKKAA